MLKKDMLYYGRYIHIESAVKQLLNYYWDCGRLFIVLYTPSATHALRC